MCSGLQWLKISGDGRNEAKVERERTMKPPQEVSVREKRGEQEQEVSTVG